MGVKLLPNVDATTIRGFCGTYRFLSNFWISPFRVEGRIWRSVEHFFQAHKTTSLVMQNAIADLQFPADAKKAGKLLNIRPDWNKIRLDIMYVGVLAKFNQNRELRMDLLGTGVRELIDTENGNDNEIGKILMKVRNEIRVKRGHR